MAQKRSEDTSTTVIETTPEAAPTAPPWLAEALTVLRALRVSGLWASLPDRLRVEVAPSPLVTPRPAAPFHSRDERAHRRRTWQTCFERNRRPPDGGCLLRIHGVPTALEPMLGMPRDIQHAA